MSDVEMANDEGADPTDDIKKQNADPAATDRSVPADDRHKVERLAKAGEPAVDPNAENPT